VRHHPNWSLVARRASREFIPDANAPTPRRLRSPRSTSGDDSSPPFRPSARSRGPTMPSADCCGAVRADGSPLSPILGHPADLPWSAVRPSVHRRPIDQVQSTVAGGLCGRVPARPDGTTPCIRFVSLAPHVRSTLPSDAPSRGHPCASLVLRLHVYLDRRLSLPSMTACTAHTPGMSRAGYRVGSMPWLGAVVVDSIPLPCSAFREAKKPCFHRN
jgi:hypothetical protein